MFMASEKVSFVAFLGITSQKVRAALYKIPLNPPFSKGEVLGMPILIEKLQENNPTA
jgi:hypothetical protein